jgi:hypothetical protein
VPCYFLSYGPSFETPGQVVRPWLWLAGGTCNPMEKCIMSTLHPSLDVPIVCAEKSNIKSKLDYTTSDANLVKSNVGILMCNVDLHKVQSTYDNLVKSHLSILMCNMDMHEVQSTYDKVQCGGSSKVQS